MYVIVPLPYSLKFEMIPNRFFLKRRIEAPNCRADYLSQGLGKKILFFPYPALLLDEFSDDVRLYSLTLTCLIIISNYSS